MIERLVELLVYFDGSIYNASGLLFVTLGVFILIRMTGFPDLTVDGSFTIGAAFFAILMVNEWGVAVGLSGAFFGGILGGFLTWSVNHFLGVGKVVSGVLSMLILILSAPYIASSTMSLQKVDSAFSAVDSMDWSITELLANDQPLQLHLAFSFFVILFFLLILILVFFFFRKRIGLRLRYSGAAESPIMVSAKERAILSLLGLAAGNGLVAVGGAIEAQRRGGYTANMGLGIILVAMSVLILGEAIIKTFKKRDFLHVGEYMVAAIAGTFIYSFGIQALLLFDLAFADLRLMTSLFLLALLGIAGRFFSSSTRLF